MMNETQYNIFEANLVPKHVSLIDTWNGEQAGLYTLSTVLVSMFLAVGLFGNVLVLGIYNKRMKSKKDDRYFIPALAIVDLFGSIFSSSLSLIQNVLPVMFPGMGVCRILNLGTSTFIMASLLLLLIISIQRYQKICKPFGFQMSLFFKRSAVVLTFAIAFALSIPFAFLYKKIGIKSTLYNETGYVCGTTPGTERFGDIYRGIVIFAEVLAVLGMSMLYSLVGHRLYRQFSVTRQLKAPSRVFETPLEILNNNPTENIDGAMINPSEHANGGMTSVSERGGNRTTDKSTSNENSGSNSVEVVELNSNGSEAQETPTNLPEIPVKVPTIPGKLPRRNFSSTSTTSYFGRGRLDSSRSSADGSSNHSTFSARRYSIMFMVISLVAILCYIPPWVLILLESKDGNFWNNLTFFEVQAFSVIRRLYIVNHIANPFIYGFFDSKFRHEIKRLLCKCVKQ